MGDRLGNLREAVRRLREVLEIIAISSVYETVPVGPRNQPDYLNIAVAGRTNLAPPDLLGSVKEVERALGRRPTYRWGPRLVDVDILLYEGVTLSTPTLTIPHPEMAHRAFVLVPLNEIAPRAVHPLLHRSVAELLHTVSGQEGVRPLPDLPI